jgi:hypothetical protein
MGYSTVIGLGILLAAAILAAVWIRRGQAAAVAAARETAACDEATRRGKEHAAVAEVERRDLPGGVAGPRLRDVPKRLDG